MACCGGVGGAKAATQEIKDMCAQVRTHLGQRGAVSGKTIYMRSAK